MTAYSPALELRGVSFSAPSGFWMRHVHIIRELDLVVPEGSICGLVGPNGAGKTTTLKLCAGLLRPIAGTVFLFQIPTSEPESRRSVGFLTENQYIYPHLRLEEWLDMLGGFSGISTKERSTQVNNVLKMADLVDRRRQMMRTLSKGQLQRAGLAQALLHRPRLLLLDEPMSGLDPVWRFKFQRILKNFQAEGGTILFSSHVLGDVEKLCDHMVLLKGGEVCWSGAIGQLPRKIKGYEVVCRVPAAEIFSSMNGVNRFLSQPDGNFLVSLSREGKNSFLSDGVNAGIEIESIVPIQEEVEEVLFGFSMESEGN